MTLAIEDWTLLAEIVGYRLDQIGGRMRKHPGDMGLQVLYDRYIQLEEKILAEEAYYRKLAHLEV